MSEKKHSKDERQSIASQYSSKREKYPDELPYPSKEAGSSHNGLIHYQTLPVEWKTELMHIAFAPKYPLS